MGEEAALGRFKAATALEAYGLLERMAPEPKEQFETVTDELGRIFSRNVLTNEVRQVSGAPPEKPLTYEQRAALKRIPTDVARGDYWKNPKTGDTKWIDFGVNPPAGYTQRVPRVEREVSDLPEKKFEFAKARSVVTAAQNIRMNPSKEAIKGDIQFHNENATGPTGFFWKSEVRKWLPDINEAIEVSLPKLKGRQLTMKDVRADARDRGISPEEVLEEIHEWMQTQEK